MMKPLLLGLMLVGSIGAAQAETKVYDIDPSHTQVYASYLHAGFSNIAIRFNTVEGKFTRLSKLTGQSKRKTGPKPGSKPLNYGSGLRTRQIAALPALYEREGLPPLRPLPPGESQMLAQSGTADFAAKIRNPRLSLRSRAR